VWKKNENTVDFFKSENLINCFCISHYSVHIFQTNLHGALSGTDDFLIGNTNADECSIRVLGSHFAKYVAIMTADFNDQLCERCRAMMKLRNFFPPLTGKLL